MRLWIVFSLILCLRVSTALAADDHAIWLPSHLASVHPRVSGSPGNSEEEIRLRIARDNDARSALERTKAELAPYLEYVRKDPMWMASRLQMYWSSHAAEVYNRGDVFDHVEGKAPVATVRFPGSRNPNTIYRAPKLEDIPPYEDDTRGVWLVNSAAPGQLMEWADPAKSGRVIDGINATIMRMAGSAAEVAWLTGDDEYARFAFTIFDTYMRGMYARKEPVDLNHGHSQTIYGMSTFEVIQEGNILPVLASTYDFLYGYIQHHHADSVPIYAETFRKWIEVTLQNGVPFNNWDLFEDNIAISVVEVLEDDAAYADHRGAEYYLNLILNQDSIRHWSLRKLAATGFDSNTGIWFEAPGYSMTVVGDFIGLINRIDRIAGTDLLQEMPVVRKAVTAMTYYAYPNGITVAWGDSHYGPISSGPARLMVENARMHHRRDDEVYFTGLAKLLDAINQARVSNPEEHARRSAPLRGMDSLFEHGETDLEPAIPALNAGAVFPATFGAPSVSYFVQRNGIDPKSGLMIAEAGSLGNHMHANGITMELFGKGLPLAPDSGIGTNYFEADHNEYYAQFPAHNTVVVDGISSYPTMLSHHGFTVNASFPETMSESAEDTAMTVADVSFLEPETNADQRRVMGTVRLSADAGYCIDIFRSHRRDGQDRTQDYFFHGLGQELNIADSEGSELAASPSDRLTFAEEALSAYDYLWDKHILAPSAMYHARYDLMLPGQSAVHLHAWMAGAEGRQLFQVLAPPARSLRDTVASTVSALPLHTIVLRQTGEAWNRPFVSVFEPSGDRQGAAIQKVRLLELKNAPLGAVGVRMEESSGREQTILNGMNASDTITADNSACQCSYAVFDAGPDEASLLMSNGVWIKGEGMQIHVMGGPGSGYVKRSGEDLELAFTRPATLEVPADRGTAHLQIGPTTLKGENVREANGDWIRFAVPPMKLTKARLTP